MGTPGIDEIKYIPFDCPVRTYTLYFIFYKWIIALVFQNINLKYFNLGM